MKTTIKKIITFVTVITLALTLATPVTAEAAAKKTPKINKTKATLTITKKKTKPAVQLKVKNAGGKKVKWTSSNKKVATVNKNGKVVAKKKGTTVVRAKVGKKTLTCKVTVKDSRKNSNKNDNKKPPVTNQPNGDTTVCQHNWVKMYKDQTVTTDACQCACGEIFKNGNEWQNHSLEAAMNHELGHGSCSDISTTNTVKVLDYEYCSKCGAKK